MCYMLVKWNFKGNNDFCINLVNLELDNLKKRMLESLHYKNLKMN